MEAQNSRSRTFHLSDNLWTPKGTCIYLISLSLYEKNPFASTLLGVIPPTFIALIWGLFVLLLFVCFSKIEVLRIILRLKCNYPPEWDLCDIPHVAEAQGFIPEPPNKTTLFCPLLKAHPIS